jgi:hypothetical protein
MVAMVASACSSSGDDQFESSSSPLNHPRHHDGGGGGPCADIGFPVIETTCPYSDGDPTCKGWACRIEFPTPGAGGERHEQHWTDSDGVHPEIAGCHQEWRADRCGDHHWLNGHLAEGCVGNLLIETNPGAGVCHPHERARMGEFKGEFVGHPDVYSCPDFCTQTGHAGGTCVTVKDVPCADGTLIDSAKCDCTDDGDADHDHGDHDHARCEHDKATSGEDEH